MAPKISKYSTALIIKYFHIKTACSLFLTARVAKIKQKAMDAPTVSCAAQQWDCKSLWCSVEEKERISTN